MRLQGKTDTNPQDATLRGLGESLGLPVRLLVAPTAGRLRLLPPTAFRGGDEWVTAGQPVAVVEKGTLALEVRAPAEARVAGVLVRDGEPVAWGQPVIWLDQTPRPARRNGRARMRT